MGLETWTSLYPNLFPRGGEINMLTKKIEEETSGDLHADLDEAQTAFDAAQASVQARADDRRQVVRHRLAALEAEDKDLTALQQRIEA